MGRKSRIRALDAAHTSAMTPDEAAAYLNDAAGAQAITQYQAITGNALRVWAASYPDDYQRLRTAAQAGSVQAEIAASLVDDPSSVLDLNDPAVRALVDGFNQSTPQLIEDAAHAALYVAGTQTQSLAQAAGLGELDQFDILEARA